MPEFPETRTSLLVRIQSPHDEEAWREFVTLYRPVVYRLARTRGLQDADAEDLAQRVVIAVQRAIGNWKADPTKGRFRSWLARIAQNAIINALTRRPPDAAAGGSSIHELLEKQPEPDPRTQQDIQREYRRSLFRAAAQRILPEFRDGTWEAFWLTTVEGMGVEEAGRVLGKSLGAIYAARSRVMRRLKDEIQQSGFDWRD
ncbi:MAG: sigma-70 family RNA polymerase sigma factor [Thermoguttaceae bacterium]|jgi:RNA polymerase sigma-70 factor (ECF subfamily)